MSLFEYIMVLTSILISLGIAELLYGVVRVLRSEFQERLFLPQAAWALFLFLHLIVIWWSRWDLHENFEWNFIQLLLSLAAPILLFILCGLIFPLKEVARDHYYRLRKPFFSILFLIAIIDLLHEILIEGSPILSLATPTVLVMAVAIIAARFSQKDLVHGIAALVCVATVLFFISMTVFELN